jgi:hypothetical protein
MYPVTEMSYVLESSEDEKTIYLSGTNQRVEILSLHEFFHKDRRLITFYLSDGGKLGGITLSDEQMDNLNREHLRDAFILALN